MLLFLVVTPFPIQQMVKPCFVSAWVPTKTSSTTKLCCSRTRNNFLLQFSLSSDLHPSWIASSVQKRAPLEQRHSGHAKLSIPPLAGKALQQSCCCSQNYRVPTALNMATNSKELRFHLFSPMEETTTPTQWNNNYQHYPEKSTKQEQTPFLAQLARSFTNTDDDKPTNLQTKSTVLSSLLDATGGWLFPQETKDVVAPTATSTNTPLWGNDNDFHHFAFSPAKTPTSTAPVTVTTTSTTITATATSSIYQSVESTTTSTSTTTTSVHLAEKGGGTFRNSIATTTTVFRSVSSVTTSARTGESIDSFLFRNQKFMQPIHHSRQLHRRHVYHHSHDSHPSRPIYQGYGASLQLTEEERKLFALLRRVREDTRLSTTLRVAGGWVRDKLLATPEFSAYHAVFQVAGKRLTSKFRPSSSFTVTAAATPTTNTVVGTNILSANEVQPKPVDIDIALDDMLGREFAEHLNEYLKGQGEETHSVGVVLKNPEKSKHLETATMKVGSFWIDFVNLRAEEYTQQDSRIPDLMRIGTASEDALRRDLTINSLFYNINTGQVEDWTGRGFDDLRKGIVATPLPPLTTLLDDPLRVLRSIRFAARLRFTMDDELVEAAKDDRVRTALQQKVSRERIGSEVELMLRSPDPVGAMRLLLDLKLTNTVFPQIPTQSDLGTRGLALLSTAHDHLADCKWSPPMWCHKSSETGTSGGGLRLLEDEEARRLLWYSAFLKPVHDRCKLQQLSAPYRQSKKEKRHSPVQQLLVDDLKRPARDAESIGKILRAADDISQMMQNGSVVSATMILLSDINIVHHHQDEDGQGWIPYMNGRRVDPTTEEDPVWMHAMDFRLACWQVLCRIGPLWRAAFILSLSEELNACLQGDDSLEYAIEGDVVDESRQELRRGIIERYDIFAASLIRLGLIGNASWNSKPLLDGDALKELLPNIPKGPTFREIMDEQADWMITHPGADSKALSAYLLELFPNYGPDKEAEADNPGTEDKL